MAKLHPDLREEEAIWRLVLSKICTLHELETTYTFDDMMRANTMLTIQNEIEGIHAESEE